MIRTRAICPALTTAQGIYSNSCSLILKIWFIFTVISFLFNFFFNNHLRFIYNLPLLLGWLLDVLVLKWCLMQLIFLDFLFQTLHSTQSSAVTDLHISFLASCGSMDVQYSVSQSVLKTSLFSSPGTFRAFYLHPVPDFLYICSKKASASAYTNVEYPKAKTKKWFYSRNQSCVLDCILIISKLLNSKF